MSKMKQGLALTLVAAVTAGASITGTMAYLQSQDSDVNVMTLGNVEIEQHEYQREEADEGTYITDEIDGQTSYVLESFEQGKDLLPIVGDPSTGDAGWDDTTVRMTQVDSYGSMQVFAGKNAQDKFVTVENTGKTDAYVRTLVAIEVGSADIDLIGSSHHSTWTKNEIGTIEVDGNTYFLYEYAYNGGQLSDGSWRHENGILPAGDTSYPNLSQVYLKSVATNEDMEAIDGNDNGTLDILVLSQAVQAAGFADAKTALNEAFGKPDEKAAEWFGGVLAENSVDTWDGTADTTWYNDTDTEFIIETAEQLAGFAKLVDEGNDFAGKTVKLGADLDLYHLAEGATDPTCFDPIGSYRNDKIFEGTFDGQNHTISKMSQNTWALDNGYYYGDLGLGLFGAVEKATVKNLVMDNASISGESALCGTIAAVAGEDVIFENITVKNSDVADYQYYAGGIVGWAGGDEQFINCNIDASTTIGGQWGDFNNANGGIIGGVSESAEILMKDCTVACKIDVHNDVVSAYEWYSYRRSGMLIGDSGQLDDPDGDNVGNAIAPNLTCENVTVIYGDWANYHYCQFNNMGYPWVRVEAGVSCDAYINIRYGHPTDANGNEVVDDNHVHNDGEKHNELIVFDQLYGGETGDRYCTYGTATHDGVNVVYNNK